MGNKGRTLRRIGLFFCFLTAAVLVLWLGGWMPQVSVAAPTTYTVARADGGRIISMRPGDQVQITWECPAQFSLNEDFSDPTLLVPSKTGLAALAGPATYQAARSGQATMHLQCVPDCQKTTCLLHVLRVEVSILVR